MDDTTRPPADLSARVPNAVRYVIAVGGVGIVLAGAVYRLPFPVVVAALGTFVGAALLAWAGWRERWR